MEKTGSNRSMMSGILSMDMFPEDVDLHGGLLSFATDSKRSINSSDFVKDTFLSDGMRPSYSRDISDKQIKSPMDLPVFELTQKLERVTTGDDIMGENIRLSSSEWVKDFEGEEVTGPTPQSMFYDSSSSIPALTKSPPPISPVYSSQPGALSEHAETPFSSPYDSNALSPILSGDLNAVEFNRLAPPLPPLSPAVTTSTESKHSANSKGTKTSTKSKKRRKRVIDESTACEPTDDDVLFGRGGFTNNRAGNVFFRQEALRLRPWYEASTKEEKYEISNVLLEAVKSKGGRFLERGSDGLWHEVIGNGARRKASQALRERIKGKSTNLLSSSMTSAKSHDASGDERDDKISGNQILMPPDVGDLIEV
jgi:hypothetical protein